MGDIVQFLYQLNLIMKLFIFFAAAALAKKNKDEGEDSKKKDKPKKEKPALPGLNGSALEAMNEVKALGASMSTMYLEDLTSYGKKDYKVNANGVTKWLNKMEKGFQQKIARCGAEFWENPILPDRRRRAKEGGKKGQEIQVMDEVDSGLCDTFMGHVSGLVDWTALYMQECCGIKKKKNKPDEKKCVKAGDKFTKKWKKIMGAFHHGAKNQPDGPLCSEDWQPVFNN